MGAQTKEILLHWKKLQKRKKERKNCTYWNSFCSFLRTTAASKQKITKRTTAYFTEHREREWERKKQEHCLVSQRKELTDPTQQTKNKKAIIKE